VTRPPLRHWSRLTDGPEAAKTATLANMKLPMTATPLMAASNRLPNRLRDGLVSERVMFNVRSPSEPWIGLFS